MSFVAFVSDTHHPFHDDNALRVVFNILEEHPPEKLVIGGDSGDYYSISRFEKDPRRLCSLSEEFEAQQEFFENLRNLLPKTKMYFLEGNHEARYRKYLIENAQQMLGLPNTNLQDQLRLKDFKIEYVKSGVIEIDGVKHMHGHLVRSASGASAKAHAEKHGKVIHGHVHRAGVFHRTDGRGQFFGIENPCLCSLNPDYMEQPDWQQGFTYLTGKGRNGAKRIGIEQVIIEDGAAVFRGDYYK